MGARYLKAEDAIIQAHYPTATRAEILALIPNRTWAQIGAHARKKGIRRTSEAWGNSVAQGRENLKNAYSNKENERFDILYPVATREELSELFPTRSLSALTTHAQRRCIHRTKEAMRKQVKIGREEAKKGGVKEDEHGIHQGSL